MTHPKAAMMIVVWITLNANAWAATAPDFRATLVGPVDNDYVYGAAINSAGDVTGCVAFQAFVQSGSTIRYLGNSPFGNGGCGRSINSRGQVAGSAVISGYEHAAFFDAGTVQDLGTLGGANSWAYGVNDSGQITGKSNFGLYPPSHAFLYSDGTMHDLGTFGGEAGDNSSGNAINASGQITGYFEAAGGFAHAFIYSNGATQDLGTGGGERTAGFSINERGQVTGLISFSDQSTHAFLYSDGSMKDIGTLGGSSGTGSGINNYAQVVGTASTSAGAMHGFLYTNGQMYDLNTLVNSGLNGRTLTGAASINDQGQIVAQSCLPPVFDMAPTPCKTLRLDPIAAPTVFAVEYYYEAWNYYFETSLPNEIAALDGGSFGGVWKRTGETFNVWPQTNNNSSPMCRFFTTVFAPKSSHVYTPFASECQTLKDGPVWQYEGVAFYVQLATVDGLCDATTVPLYRLYNSGMGGAPNHRYTTSTATLDQMVAAGWAFEGNGNTKVFACVPK